MVWRWGINDSFGSEKNPRYFNFLLYFIRLPWREEDCGNMCYVSFDRRKHHKAVFSLFIVS